MGNRLLKRLSGRVSSCRPAVGVPWLMAAAGVVWSAVGVMLDRRAYHWLRPMALGRATAFGLAGAILGLIAYRILFARLARRNIARIGAFSGRICLFAFQAWRSYLMIALMIGLGLTLRALPVSRAFLAVLYCAMGSALLIASLHYHIVVWRMLTRRKP